MTEPEFPPKIQEIVNFITQGRGSPDGPKAELEARVAVLVASEVARATHSITTNLIELTSRVGQMCKVIDNVGTGLSGTIQTGAAALNDTTEGRQQAEPAHRLAHRRGGRAGRPPDRRRYLGTLR